MCLTSWLWASFDFHDLWLDEWLWNVEAYNYRSSLTAKFVSFDSDHFELVRFESCSFNES